MESFITSLYSYLTEETDLLAFATGIYPGLAPEQTAYPFVTYDIITASRGLAMGSSRWDMSLIQFSCFSDDDSPAEAIRIADRLRFWLEDSESRFTIAGDTLVRVTLETHNLLRDPDGGWQYQLDFEFDVQTA